MLYQRPSAVFGSEGFINFAIAIVVFGVTCLFCGFASVANPALGTHTRLSTLAYAKVIALFTGDAFRESVVGQAVAVIVESITKFFFWGISGTTRPACLRFANLHAVA